MDETETQICTLKWPSGTTYQGSLKDGKMHGHGTLTFPNGNKYIGEFISGKREGRGVFLWADGESYEGDFKGNKPHGYGVYHYKSGDVYEGDFVNGIKHGEGVYRYSSGNVYRGSFERGQRHGYGRLEYNNGDLFCGEFRSDVKHGKGVYLWADGRTYEGDFLDNEPHGKGTMTWPSGDVYKGDFVSGKQMGFGVLTLVTTGQRYEGEFVDGKFEGRGILVEPNKDRYDGLFKSGLKHGSGLFWSVRERNLYSQQWHNGVLQSQTPATLEFDPWKMIVERKLIEREPFIKKMDPTKKPKREKFKLKINLEKKLTPTQYKLFVTIASYFDHQTLCRAAQVSKGWRQVLGDNEILWEALAKRRWKELYRLEKPKLGISWKILYHTRTVVFKSESGTRVGYGSFVWSNGNKYEGEWRDSRREGKGVMTYSNNDIYYGEFKDGRKHGWGVYKFFSGCVYEGPWERGRLHGKATVTYSNGDRFEGMFYRGEKMGYGVMIYARGPIKCYIGQWRRGKKEGNGKEITRMGHEYENIYLNGAPIEKSPPDLSLYIEQNLHAMTDPERLKERRHRRAQQYLSSLRWERTRRYVEQYSRPHGAEFAPLSLSQPQLRKTHLLGWDSHENKATVNSSNTLTLQQPVPKDTDDVPRKSRQKPNSVKKVPRSERTDDSIVGHEADLDDSRVDSPQPQRREKPQKSTPKSSPPPELVARALLRFKRTDSTPENISNVIIREKPRGTKIKVNLRDNKSPQPPKDLASPQQQQQQQQLSVVNSARSVSSEIAYNSPQVTNPTTHQTVKDEEQTAKQVATQNS
jgi:hypothetical protein